MDGFKIEYVSADGKKEMTWFGKPMSSMDISKISQKDVVGMVAMMFDNAHPGCKIVSLEECAYDDFAK